MSNDIVVPAGKSSILYGATLVAAEAAIVDGLVNSDEFNGMTDSETSQVRAVIHALSLWAALVNLSGNLPEGIAEVLTETPPNVNDLMEVDPDKVFMHPIMVADIQELAKPYVLTGVVAGMDEQTVTTIRYVRDRALKALS